jgi:hypothetical protein
VQRACAGYGRTGGQNFDHFSAIGLEFLLLLFRLGAIDQASNMRKPVWEWSSFDNYLGENKRGSHSGCLFYL